MTFTHCTARFSVPGGATVIDTTGDVAGAPGAVWAEAGGTGETSANRRTAVASLATTGSFTITGDGVGGERCAAPPEVDHVS